MKHWYLLLFLMLLSLTGSTQAFKKKSRWFQGPGKIQLVDGKVLSGHIYYSFHYSIVQVVKDNRSQQFKSDKVAYFEYFDEGFERQRKFYSIPYDLDNNRYKEVVFFEVIKELKEVALIKTQAYLNFDVTTGNFERLTEVLYFADNKGNIKPYVEVVHKLTGASRRIIDKYGLTSVTKRNHYKVQTYMKKEKLNEKKEEDLIKILTYLEEIR